MQVPVTITYLEMTDPAQLRPSSVETNDVQIRRVECPTLELVLALYKEVGRAWHWTDRLVWTDEHWRGYLNRPQLEVWLARIAGETAGYFELELQSGGNIEIAYFGLMPKFIGKHLGGFLLSTAVQQAWQMGASRVWVHTCTLDHPHALPNYLNRSFRITRTEEAFQTHLGQSLNR